MAPKVSRKESANKTVDAQAQNAVSTWKEKVIKKNLSELHRDRKVVVGIILENETDAFPYIPQLSNSIIEDDTVIVLPINDLSHFFYSLSKSTPEYVDPDTDNLVRNMLEDVDMLDVAEMFNDVASNVEMIALLSKLRAILLLKKHIYKYESPVRYKEVLMEEYRQLLNIPTATRRRAVKKSKKGKSKSSKSSKKSKKTKKSMKAAKVECDPCPMLENNVRRTLRAPRWHAVTIPFKTIQLLIHGSAHVDLLHQFHNIDMTVERILAVHMPVDSYEDVGSLQSFPSSQKVNVSPNGSLQTMAHENISQYSRLENKSLEQFWHNLYLAAIAPNKGPHIGNLIFLRYTPFDYPLPIQSPYYDEQCLSTYDNIKYLLEYSVNVPRMLDRYREFMKFHHMETKSQFNNASCFREYNEFMNRFPPDTWTVPIIITGLVKQIENYIEWVSVASSTQTTLNSFRAEDQHSNHNIRNFIVDVFKRYRLSMSTSNMEACRNVLYSKLVNIKLDLKPMRLHEGDFYSNSYAAYLKLRVELGEYTKQRLKYTPFYRIVKRRIENETVAQCQEINAMAEFFHRSERETKLILCSFLFNVVNWTMYQKCMYNINQHYDDEVVRFWVLQMGIMLNSKLTSDSVTSNIGTPTNRKIDFQLYEKLNQMQMLNEFCGMLEDYSSIKYYDCPLLNVLLLEVSNEGDSFGINEQSWFETLTCKCTLLFFSKSVVITLVNFLLQQEQEHYNEQKALKAAELKEKSVNVEKVVDPLEEISFIIPNTIKYRETMQLKDEVKETTSKESTLSKKKGKIAKKTIIPGKSFVSESRVSKGSSKTQTSARTPTSMPEKPPAPKLFFVEEGSYTDKLRGFDKTFVSTDGIKVEYSKYDYDDYKTVRVKLLENRFVMHMVDDGNFGFHFTLENGTIVNFVKPTDQLIKKYMQTQKLYTLTSSYRTDANRLGAPIKMENTFLISEDLVDRLHCKKRRAARKSIVETRLAAKMAAAQTIHKAQPMNSVESKTSVSLLFSSLKPKEPLGDEDDNREMKLLELTSKSQALRHLHYAQRAGVPIFKICSSKLHRFRYIKRLRSHVRINIADAVHAVMDKRKMSPKKTYVVRDIAASVDNEDVTCEDDYLITITLPSTLTIRSETDVLGRSQFRQFYHVMGPQCRDVSHEVSRTLTACGDLAVKYANGTMRLMCISGDVLHFKNPRFENRHMMSARCCRKYSPGKSYRRALRRLIARQHCHLNTRYCLNSSRKALSAREYIYMSPRSTIIAKRRRFPFPDYSIMKINGRRLRFHGGKVISKQMYYPMLTDNFALGTQKVSREDGTTVEINVRGEMVTTFLDGTQLRNRFEVEAEQLVLDIFGEEMDPWLVITLYHEFRHPNYATVTCGGRNKKCILEIPGGGRIIKHDHQIEFEIQSGIGAVIDRSRVGLKVNMCPSCKLGASATIHIEDLYCGNQVDDIHYFIQCADSFNKHLKVTYNGDFVPNEGYKCDLNYAKCKEHFMWHLPKFYAVNKDMSGTRFWTTNDYNNRNILAKRNNEVVSISSDFEDESVVFKKSSKTAIHQRFMSVNNAGEQESLQLYRRLFKLNFNKNTRDLFRVLENVVEENKDTMKESDETDEEETLQTLFSKSTGTSYATIPPLSQAQKVKDHQIVWARKKLRAHSKVTQLRSELKEPLNYWKWKAKCDAEQAMQKHLADQYNADVSVQLRHGKETALVEQSNYVNLEQRESLAHMHQMVTDMVDNLPIMSPSMALLYENAQRPFTSKLSTRDMLDDLSMYSHMKAWPPRGTSLNLGKQSEKQELRQEEMQSALVRVINQSDNSFAKVGPFESESHQEFE